MLELESQEIRQTIKGYPVIAYITSPYLELPRVMWQGKLVTVPWILNSMYTAIESANTKIAKINFDKQSTDHQIEQFNPQRMSAIINTNNNLQNVVNLIQNSQQLQHNQITENKADIATNNNKLARQASKISDLMDKVTGLEQQPQPAPVKITTPVPIDTSSIDKRIETIDKKLKHYDGIMLQLQSMTADHHLRIAAIENNIT